MNTSDESHHQPAAELASDRIADLGDWREQTLARMRTLILEADPEMIEERKWKKASNAMAGVPVWSHHGMVCTGEAYATVVKLTVARGASVPDASHLFNASLEGGTRRAIGIRKGEAVDESAFKMLVLAAVLQNAPSPKKAKPAASEKPAIGKSIAVGQGEITGPTHVE